MVITLKLRSTSVQERGSGRTVDETIPWWRFVGMACVFVCWVSEWVGGGGAWRASGSFVTN